MFHRPVWPAGADYINWYFEPQTESQLELECLHRLPKSRAFRLTSPGTCGGIQYCARRIELSRYQSRLKSHDFSYNEMSRASPVDPLLLNPVLKRARWGGRRLQTLFGKPLGPEADYAECWEVVDRGAIQSQVAAGPHAGRSLRWLMEHHRESLLGPHAVHGQFPLLIKLLDAADRLSVQVHPDCRQAAVMGFAEPGKSEAWVILEASPGSRLFVGLRSGVTAADLQSALKSGDIADCLHSFPARPGDCIYVPAGTVHAIGEGIVLAEVQQPSDLTFRLFDWGRLDADGSPRALHIEQALECINFDRGPVNPVTPVPVATSGHRCERLVASPHFVMHRHVAADPFDLVDDGQFHVLITLAATVVLRAGGHTLPLPRGSAALIPAACTERRVQPQGQATILDVSLPRSDTSS